jgi:hypothetical protein
VRLVRPESRGVLKTVSAFDVSLHKPLPRLPVKTTYTKFYSRSHDAVIRVYDDVGNVIEMHEHKGDFKEW